jgi:hypothetical protein
MGSTRLRFEVFGAAHPRLALAASLSLAAAACGGGRSDGFSAAHVEPSADAGVPDAAVTTTADADTDAPTLTSLVLSPVTLMPAFSPDIHDYYVRCAAGGNEVEVTMKPSAGATAAVAQPSVHSGNEATLAVAENDAIVATASKGGVKTSYWVRCLPHDFPAFSFTTLDTSSSPSPGYYLVGTRLPKPTDNGYAIVLDTRGVPVWYRATKPGTEASNIDVLRPNVISFVDESAYTFDSYSGSYSAYSLATGTVSKVAPNGSPLDPHELVYLDNGDYLIFSWPIESNIDLTGLGKFGTNEYMIDCVIQEVNPSGETVWGWDAMDHFDPAKDSVRPITTSVRDSTGIEHTVIDTFHCNSIDVDPKGDLLVSSRLMDSIFMISKATGTVLWKLGGASYNRDNAPFIAIEGDPMNGFHGQHDARLQPNGNISVYDDQMSHVGPARGLVLSYDLTARKASIVSQFLGTVSASAMGSFRIQPDGSAIIGWGISTKNPTFTDIDENGKARLEFSLLDGDASYRATKVDTSALDLDLLRSTAGQTD